MGQGQDSSTPFYTPSYLEARSSTPHQKSSLRYHCVSTAQNRIHAIARSRYFKPNLLI